MSSTTYCGYRSAIILKLNKVKNNTRQTWKLLNEMIHKRKNKPKSSSLFKCNNQEISDPTEIANRFCNYFSNIGPNLANKIPRTNVSHLSFLHGNFQDSIFIDPTTDQEIIRIANNLKSTNTCGYDNISTNIVKH